MLSKLQFRLLTLSTTLCRPDINNLLLPHSFVTLFFTVIQEPPYEIQESGCASIEIPIHVYLKYSNKPKRIRLRYSLHTENNSKSSSDSRCVYYDVENPTEELWQALMQGGGEVIARTGSLANKLVVLFSDTDEKPHKIMKAKKYKFVEPIDTPRKHGPKKTKPFVLEEICSKCGDSNVDLRKQLRAVAMTDDEITRVSQLCASYASYEKSVDALLLPPLSDPIYRVPELPASLRAALTSVEGHYSTQ